MGRHARDSATDRVPDGAARFSGSYGAVVPAPVGEVFALVTDLARLPEWNRAVVRVVDVPPALEVGAEWVVTVSPPGLPSWPSRSRVRELDPQNGVFAYRSQTDDGNPSYTDWRWTVAPEGDGSRLTVRWDLHPLTFWRRHLFGRMRRRSLAKSEVPASVAALTRILAGS